jgi:hypothetical protein
MFFILTTQWGCALTTTKYQAGDGVGGKTVSESCSSQCIAKVDAGNGQEKCMKFAQGMALACKQYEGSVAPNGSFTYKP